MKTIDSHCVCLVFLCAVIVQKTIKSSSVRRRRCSGWHVSFIMKNVSGGVYLETLPQTNNSDHILILQREAPFKAEDAIISEPVKQR